VAASLNGTRIYHISCNIRYNNHTWRWLLKVVFSKKAFWGLTNDTAPRFKKGEKHLNECTVHFPNHAARYMTDTCVSVCVYVMRNILSDVNIKRKSLWISEHYTHTKWSYKISLKFSTLCQHNLLSILFARPILLTQPSESCLPHCNNYVLCFMRLV
jgi:hypothetical protein